MKNFLISIKITLAFCVILFVGYVLVLWGISALVMPNNGRAQVATLYGKVVGA
ncbi:MAG: potassium-transporting ATPase subunit C, partial [Bacteroidales bacterium]